MNNTRLVIIMRRTWRFVVLMVCSFLLSLSWGAIAYGQFSGVPSTPIKQPHHPPDGVTRLGEYESAWILSPLDNKVLFAVISPTVLNRDEIPEKKIPVEIRAQEINDRLWRVFYRTINAKKTPRVTISVLNNRPIIQVSDDYYTRPVRLVTITEPDADWHGKNLDELAKEWQAILQDEMVRFEQLTDSKVIWQRITQATQILLGLVIGSLIIWFLRHLLNKKREQLEATYQADLLASRQSKLRAMTELESSLIKDVSESIELENDAEEQEITDLRSRFLNSLQFQSNIQNKLELNKFLKWFLFWILIGIWYVGIARIITILPLLMRWSLNVWAVPLFVLLIWFGVSLAIRISKSLINCFVYSWKINPLIPLGEAQRIALRTNTIAEALKGLVTVVLITIGIIWTLGLFNIPTSSILAGSAVIGLAISFGSQSVVKDLVNGCLILIEDQFAVGDVIEIGDKSGLVENLNLRVTQLRNSEGQLITIPNSNVMNVCNLTRSWSRVDFSIIVDYDNDPEKVLELLRQIAEQMYSEPEWRDRLLELPDVLGIDELSHAGMLVRVWIKTAPLEQWAVGREFRLRVRCAFASHNIQIGRPQQINYTTHLISPPQA